MLYLGIWDDDFVNNQQTALGSLFLPLQKYKMNRPIGIVQAAKQQLAHKQNENLKKAQELAIKIYNTFIGSSTGEDAENQGNQKGFPPIVQFYDGAPSAMLTGLPCPAFILINRLKANEFANFSALPHECGHVLAHTPKGNELLKEIRKEVKKRFDNNVKDKKKHKIYLFEYWDKWMEECFADAVAVATIKEGEVFSLANLFQDRRTNKIYKNHDGNDFDEHPNPFIRVLLTIEILKLLDGKFVLRYFVNSERNRDSMPQQNSLHDLLKEKWLDLNREINNDYDDDQIFNLHKDWWHKKGNFTDAISIVAECLVNVSTAINMPSLKTIFSKFNEPIALELIGNIRQGLSKNSGRNLFKNVYDIKNKREKELEQKRHKAKLTGYIPQKKGGKSQEKQGKQKQVKLEAK